MPGIEIRLAASALLLLQAGCSTLRKTVDANLDLSDSACIAGQTHVHEVLSELGPPTRMTATDDGFVFLYEEFSILEMQAGLSGGEGWWQLIKLTMADADLRRQTLLLHFDSDGLLRAGAFEQTRESLGRAGAVQPLVELQPIVDTATYTGEASAPMIWGAALLRPLPQTLNAAQCLVSGDSGLELSGTPAKAGQQTLEMQ